MDHRGGGRDRSEDRGIREKAVLPARRGKVFGDADIRQNRRAKQERRAGIRASGGARQERRAGVRADSAGEADTAGRRQGGRRREAENDTSVNIYL